MFYFKTISTLVLGFSYGVATYGETVSLMPPERLSVYKAILPRVEDSDVDAILTSEATLWYDAQSIVPGYQDSMGDPRGFRPNTIESILIDLAVPGGWNILFSKRGKFQFPFASGGADNAENLEKINFWHVPVQSGERLPVVYWKLNFSRWRWMFPLGTAIGEVLLVNLPDGSQKVFEIRVRRREIDHWSNRIYRPFPTAWHLAEKIKELRSEWMNSPELKAAIQTLMDETTLVPRTLETKSFPGTFEKLSGHLDYLPEFTDSSLVKDLLSQSLFLNMGTLVWKQSGSRLTYAPSARTNLSIVPKNYDGGVLAVNDVSCRRCHKDAGRGIGEFQGDLVAYGELWGEDEIFSWHPFETTAFVDKDGNVKNFNDDNRRLRPDFVNAGLVKPYNPSSHPASLYRELPRDWTYHPIN